MKSLEKILATAITTAMLLAHASHGQPIPGLSPKEKAALQEKQAEEKAADRAYRASLGHIPDSKKMLIHGEICEHLMCLRAGKANSAPTWGTCILTKQDEVEQWMTAPAGAALKLQRPLPDGVLKIVATGERKDEAA